jgi:hypothetical protein
VVETVTDNYGVIGSTRQTFIAGATQLVVNPSFETGSVSPWRTELAVDSNPADAFDGTHSVTVAVPGDTFQQRQINQSVAVPAYKASATLQFHIWVQDPGVSPGKVDTLTVDVLSGPHGPALATLTTLTTADADAGYATYTYDMSAYRGHTVVLQFLTTTNPAHSALHTLFHLDDVTLTVPP